jgi:hypothetical protein
MAVPNSADRALAMANRGLRTASVAWPGQRHVEFTFDHGMDELANPLAHPGLNRIEPIVEKINSRFRRGCEESGFVVMQGFLCPVLQVSAEARARNTELWCAIGVRANAPEGDT